MGDLLPSQLSIDALNTTTPNLAALADIAKCTYMHGRLTPSQASIHALNNTTPNWGDLPQRTSTYKRPFTRGGNCLVLYWYTDVKFVYICQTATHYNVYLTHYFNICAQNKYTCQTAHECHMCNMFDGHILGIYVHRCATYYVSINHMTRNTVHRQN